MPASSIVVRKYLLNLHVEKLLLFLLCHEKIDQISHTFYIYLLNESFLLLLFQGWNQIRRAE